MNVYENETIMLWIAKDNKISLTEAYENKHIIQDTAYYQNFRIKYAMAPFKLFKQKILCKIGNKIQEVFKGIS